jgi:predicted esterase
LLDASELILFGYDWGGCIVLRVGALLRKVPIPALSKLIAFMPTYVERQEYRNELAYIPIPTLILWDKNDAVRNYRQSCVVNGLVGCRTLHLLDLRNAVAASVYRKHSNEVA